MVAWWFRYRYSRLCFHSRRRSLYLSLFCEDQFQGACRKRGKL